MKNLQIIIFIFCYSFSMGQVSIGKENVDGKSTILDFDDTNNKKGIILSTVDNIFQAITEKTDENNGTFLFDKSDHKVKMYENNTWISLSETGEFTNSISNSSAESGDGVIIGEETTKSKGVLVLESKNKAMILPKITNPHTTVKSPYPGMMCYDNATKSLAVFNGKVWNYWK